MSRTFTVPPKGAWLEKKEPTSDERIAALEATVARLEKQVDTLMAPDSTFSHKYETLPLCPQAQAFTPISNESFADLVNQANADLVNQANRALLDSMNFSSHAESYRPIGSGPVAVNAKLSGRGS